MPRRKASSSPIRAQSRSQDRAQVERREGTGGNERTGYLSERALLEPDALVGMLDAIERNARLTAERLERIAEGARRLREELAQCADDLTCLSVLPEDARNA